MIYPNQSLLNGAHVMHICSESAFLKTKQTRRVLGIFTRRGRTYDRRTCRKDNGKGATQPKNWQVFESNKDSEQTAGPQGANMYLNTMLSRAAESRGWVWGIPGVLQEITMRTLDIRCKTDLVGNPGEPPKLPVVL